jgi:hypothetical protein
MDFVVKLIAAIVAGLGGAAGIGAIIQTVATSRFNKAMRKNNALLDAAFNPETMSQLIADKLAGKTMNIDVTALTEKAMKKLDARVEKLETLVNSLKGILVAMGKGTIKLKALTDDERTELASAIQELASDYKPPAKEEVMTVRLEPIPIKEEKTETVEDSGVNFGGLE